MAPTTKLGMILLEDLYQELEVWYPLLRLREAGCDVHLVAPKKGYTYI